jgi:GNAT superfamily N-acetyltransferase
MTEDIRIREAFPSDSAGLARVRVDSWRTTYAHIVPDEHLAAMSYETQTQRWLERLTTLADKTFVYVAETASQEIVGYAFGGPERENDPVYHGELYALYLLQTYQRRGIGKDLVVTTARRLMEEGFANMLIWVLAENPSRAFYAALGGKHAGEKMVVIGGRELREIGYGWEDLSPVIRQPSSVLSSGD